MTDDRFAIIIGCNNYPKDPKQFSTLRSAENDARGVRDILVEKCNFNNENIKLFTSETHWEILKEINMCLKQVQSDDFVLIYFSGHGKLDINNNLHLPVSNTEVGALEATSLPISSINDYIDKSSTNRVVLILDCCYSGAVGRLFSKGSVDGALQVAAAKGKGKYILTASTGIQVAQEKEGQKYSIFTKYFIEGLKSGEADSNHDEKITVDELYTYVYAKVKKDNIQEPMKFASGVQGEIVLVDKVGKLLMPESLSVEMLLSEKSRELEGYTALRHELFNFQRNLAGLKEHVTRFLGEDNHNLKRHHFDEVISEIDRLTTRDLDSISYALENHSFLKEDSQIAELTEIIVFRIWEIKGKIWASQSKKGHPILTLGDLGLVNDIDMVASKTAFYLDSKIEDIERGLVKISSSEDKKQFEEDKKKFMQPSPDEERIEEIRKYLEEDNEALTMIEKFRERGDLDIDRINRLLNEAGFDATIRDVRRLLGRLEELGAVEKVNLNRYRLSGIAEKVFA